MKERRKYQRLNLTKPLKGRFGNRQVILIDVSATGAMIEDGDEIPVGQKKTLRFTWRRKKVMIKAETVRKKKKGRTGLRFLEDSKQLKRLIKDSATEILRAQQANMEGNREDNVVGDETLTAASSGLLRKKGYMVYNLENGQWTKRGALIAEQPPNGFTVSANEPEDQVALLRDAYQRGDEEARRMTRLLAELSVATVKP